MVNQVASHVSGKLDDITIADFVTIFRYRYKFVILFMLLAGAGATGAAFVKKPVYRAEAIIAPVGGDATSGGLAQLGGQFGGLASIAGISLGGAGSREAEAFATLNSRVLADAIITDRNLLPVLFPKKWDFARSTWIDPDRAPTLWDGNRVFSKKIRRITEDKKAGLITVAIEWTNPKLAADLVKDLVGRANQRLREQAIAHSLSNIAFLQKQLEQTSVIEIRQAIYRLLEAEIKATMLAEGNQEYAFKVIDPVVIPEDKISPIRVVWAAIGLMAGFVMGTTIALFLFIVRGRSLRAPEPT